MSVSFGRTTQNSFPSGSARTCPGLSAGLADAGPARPERKKAANLLIAARGAAGEVEVDAVLDRLGIGDRHEAHADGRVLVNPDDDLVLPLRQDLPAQRRRTEPGQSGQIVSVTTMWWSRTGMPAVCAARWTVSRKPAVLPRMDRSPEVTPRDSARIV